jgi:hypothetical protein
MMSCHASKQEKRQAMPGDSLVPDAIGSMTHAVTIHAPLEGVWPWIAQMGAGRAGWYSYDHIDNAGYPSSESILPEYQQILPGDILPALPGAKEAFLVAEVEVPRHLVLTVPGSSVDIQVSWEFLLQPVSQGSTRLIVRARISRDWPTPIKEESTSMRDFTMIERIYTILHYIPKPLMLAAASIGHYVMEARMLRGIKRRAESVLSLDKEDSVNVRL